jgi:hypothetical protein
MMRVVKRRAMSERGAMAGRKRVWKKVWRRMRMKKPRVTRARARGMPETGERSVRGLTSEEGILWTARTEESSDALRDDGVVDWDLAALLIGRDDVDEEDGER